MKLRRSLYARLVIVRGEQCAQGAAWPTERLEQAPGSAVGSLALAGTSSSPSHRLAERRRRRPQVHGSASQRAVGGGGRDVCPVPCRVEVALSEYSVASTRPVSG